VARQFRVDERRLLRRGKDTALVEARAVVCYFAVRVLAIKTRDVGQIMGLGQSGVSRAVLRGEVVMARDASLRNLLASSNSP
jgi:chromosomal replication initiation ATPase DnaA